MHFNMHIPDTMMHATKASMISCAHYAHGLQPNDDQDYMQVKFREGFSAVKLINIFCKHYY